MLLSHRVANDNDTTSGEAGLITASREGPAAGLVESTTRKTAAQAACKVIGGIRFARGGRNTGELGFNRVDPMQTGDFLDQINLACQIIPPGGNLEST